MVGATFDKSRNLPLYARIGEAGVPKILTFNNANGTPRDISSLNFQIPVKKRAGFNLPNLFLLTIGDGLTVEGDDNNKLRIEITAEQATQQNDSVFWTLYAEAEDHTWLNGFLRFHNGEFDGIEETDTITIYENGEEITIIISGPESGGLLSIQDGNGTTIDNTDPDNPIVNLGGEISVDTIIDVNTNAEVLIGSAADGYGLVVSSATETAGLTTSSGGFFADKDGSLRIADGRESGTLRGAEYGQDTYGEDFTSKSLIHKAYADNRYKDIHVSTTASTVTLTPSTFDAYEITAQAEALTIANPSTDYANFDGFIIRLEDNGTARALTFGNKYRAQGEALPSTTTLGKVMIITALRDSTADKYDVRFSEEV